VAIWAFIGSECMLFASLISTYLIYKGRSVVGPFPHEWWCSTTKTIGFCSGESATHVVNSMKPILNIPVTSMSTFVLLRSSLLVDICALYWHFVDVVWIAIFTLVYLIQ